MIRLALILAITAKANAFPYPLPDASLRFPLYAITLRQAEVRLDAPEFFTRARHIETNSHHDTSWTDFGFAGGIVILIKFTRGTTSSYRVLPSQHQIESFIPPESAASFSIEKSGQYTVEINGGMDEHPLPIYADPPENKIPERDSPLVRWFHPVSVRNIRFLP